MKLTILGLAFVALTLSACKAYGEIPHLRQERYYARAYAEHYHVSPALVFAIITQESGWHPHVVSRAGAIGLMQVLPSTARQYGVTNLFNIEDNLYAGVRYLANLIHQFGDLRLAVAAYYCGESRITKVGLSESDPRVIDYVASVESLYRRNLNNGVDSSR